jgi:hypothetical protein
MDSELVSFQIRNSYFLISLNKNFPAQMFRRCQIIQNFWLLATLNWNIFMEIGKNYFECRYWCFLWTFYVNFYVFKKFKFDFFLGRKSIFELKQNLTNCNAFVSGIFLWCADIEFKTLHCSLHFVISDESLEKCLIKYICWKQPYKSFLPKINQKATWKIFVK